MCPANLQASSVRWDLRSKQREAVTEKMNTKQARDMKDIIINSNSSQLNTSYDQGQVSEIKRRLLLGRKVMTNLDSIFKSREITLPTKVCLVKAMVFPVVMYGCESWTVKKAER